jgi:hypothetical protein
VKQGIPPPNNSYFPCVCTTERTEPEAYVGDGDEHMADDGEDAVAVEHPVGKYVTGPRVVIAGCRV